MSATWNGEYEGPVGGVASVLFTSDCRVLLEHDDATTRVAVDWERDEALLQMLSWRDSATQR